MLHYGTYRVRFLQLFLLLKTYIQTLIQKCYILKCKLAIPIHTLIKPLPGFLFS